jgi:hypothetical protein
MKVDERGQPNLTPREERAVLDEIRNDHELIARLRITQFELEALSKCALMGTLTCKQDMLFLLREIREATSPAIDHPTFSNEPAPPDDPKEESVPELQRIPVRGAPAVMPEAASLEGIVRRRLPGQFGSFIWMVAAAVAVVSVGLVVMLRWQNIFTTSIGSPVSQAPDSGPWYSSLDSFNVLITCEILFVTSVALVMYLRSRKDSRRFKVRPGRRSR